MLVDVADPDLADPYLVLCPFLAPSHLIQFHLPLFSKNRWSPIFRLREGMAYRVKVVAVEAVVRKGNTSNPFLDAWEVGIHQVAHLLQDLGSIRNGDGGAHEHGGDADEGANVGVNVLGDEDGDD